VDIQALGRIKAVWQIIDLHHDAQACDLQDHPCEAGSTENLPTLRPRDKIEAARREETGSEPPNAKQAADVLASHAALFE
jgi:hypothetical protein